MTQTGDAASAAHIEELWRARLRDARQAYQAAINQFRTASEDLRRAGSVTPDQGFGVQRAIVAESRARAEYLRLLQLFTDLAINSQFVDN